MTIPAPHFDVYTCELSGTTLVEASAGTGKTWALCGLYLRLLLERGLQVQQILVVTFTKAATAELRERIRGRIAEALAFVRDGAASGADTFVPHYVAGLRETHGLADRDIEAALELALQTFDEASILTIHGFCQRALADTPFVSQMPLSLDAVADDDEFVLQAANDFWRRRIAGETLDAALAAFLVQRKDSPARFAELLRRQLQKPLAEVRWPAAAPDGAATLADTAAAFAAAHEAARDQWRAGRGEIVGCLQAGRYKPEAIDAGAKAWDGLLACADALATFETKLDKAALFGSARLSPATNKGCTAPAHPFFDAAQRWLDLRAQTQTLLARTRLALLRELLAEGAAAVRKAKRASRVVAFDDMLANLHDRLAEAPALAAALRERFPAALVDEFQDTDPLQFAILRRIYAAEHRLPVFLVGDPKQAIYSFRNADLPTYLAARAEAAFEATLADNQRACELLIDATNALFGANDRAFMLEGLAFQPVGFGKEKPRKSFVDRSTPAADTAPLQVWMLPTDAVEGAAESGFAGEPALKKPDALAAAAQATAAEIARLISAGQRGEITLAGAPLRAGDIAVLVRSHAQGARMREALARLGVASVELSQASVFRGSDAEELERLLAAIVDPTRETLLRAALATVWIGLDAAAIEALASDETALLHHVQRFVQARETWIARGAGYMLREMLRADGIAARLLARPDGERRLTNALHLIELLHDASQAHPAPDALLRWLQTQRTSERGADDAAQLRLESDRNLVQIVTIHKAKGLEYAVVFCPFVFDGYRHGARGPADGIEYHDAGGARVIDFRKGLDDAFDEKAIAAQRRIESAAEDLRLIYVALTRAVHRCVIVAGGYLTGPSASAAESRRSLLNWLVAGQGQTPQEWLDPKHTPANAAAAWQALAAKAGAAFRLTALPRAPGIPVRADAAAPESLAALAAPVSMPPGWSIGSFSALARGAAHERSAVDHDTLLGAAGVQPPALPAPAADAGAAPSAEDDVVRFARGAAAGDCVHALFERIDFTAPAGWPQAAADTLRAHAPTLPPAGAQGALLRERMLLRMLDDVLHTPLPVGTGRPLRLASVAPGRRLSELEFHLPSHALDAARLNETLAALGYAVDRLAFRTLRGYLTGFIDLVFEHDGRFFVLDWKSNHLGDTPADYAAPAVAAAMAAHGYHLQALLYCVALDRMLRRRLAGYDPARHFGGVIYLFVRGVRPGWMDAAGAPCGVHFDRPAPGAIARVSALFGEASA